MKTIFVQIASYRDPELLRTIQSCLKQAKHPERLTFGILNQYDDDTKNIVNDFKTYPNFTIKEQDWRDSRGVGIARYICNSLYQGEDFTLQIDSHMRFKKNWDEDLIDEWQKCEHPKAVLSSYPPEFYYSDSKEEVYIDLPPSLLVVRSFDLGYIPVFKSVTVPTTINKPYKANFCCGGFLFTIGSVCKEVPYCREICFTGEEIVHSVRLFTHGYKMYTPHEWSIYHLYKRPKSHRFWNDFTSDKKLESIYVNMNQISSKWVKDSLANQHTELWGSSAALKDFENYSGINFQAKVLHPDQLSGIEPPYATTNDWIETVSPIKLIPLSITIDTSPYDMSLDYDFWYFGLHDQDGQELVRDDITRSDWNTTLITINKEYPLRRKPAQYTIWPHSRSRGWLEKKVFDLT